MFRRFAFALSLTTALTVCGATQVQAGPVIGAVAAFASSGIGGFIVSEAAGFALNEASTLVQRWLSPSSSSAASASSGVKLNLGRSGVDPMAFLLGYRGTAGTLNYHGSWGQDGGTPNAYYTQEIILCDLPMRWLAGAWASDTRITIPDMSGARPTPQGWPIPELASGGQDYAWIYFRDGTQIAADPFLIDTFGGSDHPYTADMIGLGRAIVVVTIRVNSTVYPGDEPPGWIWEGPGIDLYDISQDTSAGGAGTQRLADRSTWRPSNNLAVQIFNILQGIYWDGQWIFGLQDTSLAELPASAWIAAINECNVAVALAAGGTEPQYAGSLEVQVNTQAADVIEDLLRACSGRLAEIGGRYKPLIGTPPAAVYAFTDASVLITRDRGIDPFPAIDDTYNAGQGSYPEPSQGWRMKDAAPYSSDELQAEDGGQRLAPDLQLDACYSGTQAQRVIQGGVLDGRNFRRPSLVLPPEASELEPLDVVSWDSASQGYDDKLFLVDQLDDEPTYLTPLSLLETDPSAFGWDPSTDERPTTLGLLTPSRPPAQVLIGFSLSQAFVEDSTGTVRRPGLTFGWDGTVDDVRAVGFQVRSAASGGLMFSDSTDDVSAGQISVASPAFIPGMAVQGRGKYYAKSGRTTLWSNQEPDGTEGPWLDCTIPNVLITGADIAEATIIAAKFDVDVQNLLGNILPSLQQRAVATDDLLGEIAENVASLTATTQQIKQVLAVKANAMGAQIVVTQQVSVENQQSIADLDTRLDAVNDNLAAEVEQREQAVAGVGSALASLQEDIAVTFGSIGAAGAYKFVVTADATSQVASWTVAVRATNGQYTATSAFQLLSSIVAGTVTSQANLMADNITFVDTAGGQVAAPFFTAIDPATGLSYVGITNLRVDNIKSLDAASFEIDGTTANGYGQPFWRIG